MKFYEQFFKNNKYIKVDKIRYDIYACSKFCRKCTGNNSMYGIYKFPIVGELISFSKYNTRKGTTYYTTFKSNNEHVYSIKCDLFDINEIYGELIDLLYKK